ncbi:hypothetical protein [Legionella worsleiensis]|uniref:Uncharacterized protein n=1 Tax=Legionella worsleiensis TaxID=45076 RepID=A0A0W1A923_9GAMM|nr:hypothetical protein [Legionella worsleiensis]KTD77825.1 hypothetical protein Lwor_1707 [Legionella worsleiensis]STY33067.1 Uncharacterised protein [Legionella worsleiensis]
MTKIEKLMYSLATVIIRYHDSLASKKLITARDIAETRPKSRQYATELIRRSGFIQNLENIIKNCTIGYEARRPFLEYLLNEIVLIHSYLNKTTSFTPEELDKYTLQIFTLLVDIKGCLNTPKGSIYVVTKHQSDLGPQELISLPGCINDAYVGNYFCNSGIFLKKEVLKTLEITHKDSDDKIWELAKDICLEHQDTILVSEMKITNSILEQDNREQKQIVESLTQQLAELQANSSQLASLLREKEDSITYLTGLMEQQAQQLLEQQKQLSEQARLLDEPVQMPRPIINGFACTSSFFGLDRAPRLMGTTNTVPPESSDLGI